MFSVAHPQKKAPKFFFLNIHEIVFKKVTNALKEKGTSIQSGQMKENPLTMKTKTKSPKKPPASEFGIKAQPLCFSYSLHTVMFTEPHSDSRK